MRLALRDRVVDCVPGRPLLMGIVNANPDSFSDARRLSTLDEQVAAALAQVSAGADLDRRRRRVRRDLHRPHRAGRRDRARRAARQRLVAEGVTVSVDTFKAPVAAAALDAGRRDDQRRQRAGRPRARAPVRRQRRRRWCVMHTRAAPKEVRFPALRRRRRRRRGVPARRGGPRGAAEGVAAEQLVARPGPGLRQVARPRRVAGAAGLRAGSARSAAPLLAAVSRKYFLGAITGRAARPAPGRLGGRRAVGRRRRRGAAARPRRGRGGRRAGRPRRAARGAPRCPPSTPPTSAEVDPQRWVASKA